MKWLTALARVGIHQARNVLKLLIGRPLTTPPLGSVTLDQDDVELAKKWLKNRQDWFDESIVSEYEQGFAQWNGSKYVFAFMGARVALSACICALDLQPGDEVILPGYTCVVVPNAFHFAGITTVYCDIELDTYGMDASLIASKITPKTRAILMHHLYGLVCRDYEAIIAIAREQGLKVIEDCAQATGAEYQGRKVGHLGDVAIYSSEQSKVFTTVQGGIAVTNDEALHHRLQDYWDRASYPDEKWIDKLLHNLLLNYYQIKHPQRWWRGDLAELVYGRKRLISTTSEEEAGIKPAHYGMRMPAPIAALSLHQLSKIDRYNELRRQTAKKWDAWCETNGYRRPVVIPDSTPVYLRYPVLVEEEKKRDVSWAIRELGVRPGVWFLGNAHPVNWNIENCPNADKAVAQCINFPTVI